MSAAGARVTTRRARVRAPRARARPPTPARAIVRAGPALRPHLPPCSPSNSCTYMSFLYGHSVRTSQQTSRTGASVGCPTAPERRSGGSSHRPRPCWCAEGGVLAKSLRFELRLSLEEKRRLESEAESEGLSVAALIRSRVLGDGRPRADAPVRVVRRGAGDERVAASVSAPSGRPDGVAGCRHGLKGRFCYACGRRV